MQVIIQKMQVINQNNASHRPETESHLLKMQVIAQENASLLPKICKPSIRKKFKSSTKEFGAICEEHLHMYILLNGYCINAYELNENY